MTHVLTVYCSRTGFTRRIAEEIGQRCGGPVEPIEEARSRAGFFGYLRSAREALKKIAVAIRPAKLYPGDFDLVVLGTPVWAGHVSSPMRAYVMAHRGEFKRIATFCTLGGSGAAKTLAELAALCEREPVATLAIRDADIERSRFGPALDEFVATAVGSSGSSRSVAPH